MKKGFWLFFASFVIWLALNLDFKGGPSYSGCPFCSKELLAVQSFFEGDLSRAILSYKPAVEGHVLVIPKRHVTVFEDLTSEEIADMGEMIKKVDAVLKNKLRHKDYLLIQKNGKRAGQSVPHVHFHYLPRKENHLWFTLRFFLNPWLKPLSKQELKESVSALSS